MRRFCSSSCQAPKKLETSHFYLFQYLSRQSGTMCFLLFQPCYMQSKTISDSRHHHHVFYL
ncbi:BnaC04g15420D [Brassica napus]|uniref:BnaC04g15420D protein n=1 Tax=Brassica napus TaxID=3708 RepID=A0A078FSF7_BRANA|nr:BnaC04g15420D [Brassica napus]